MTVAERGKEFDPRQHPPVLTVPASFGKAQRNETVEAAALTGFNADKQANLVPVIGEPVAALINTLNHPDIDLHVDPEDWHNVLAFGFRVWTRALTMPNLRYD